MTKHLRTIKNQPGRKSANAWRGTLWAVVGLLVLPFAGLCEAPNANNARAVNAAERAYAEAQAQWQQNRTNADWGWKFGRACFDAAEFAGHESYRTHLADQGIEACRAELRLNPLSAAAHYYLGLNMGQKARSEKLGALKLVRDMEVEFKNAITLDQKLDYGGPSRSLGLLYKDAPGWPTSIGSKHKARELLLIATQLGPEYPENWLNLLEAYLQWKEKDKALALLPSVSERLKVAQQKFTGVEWEWSWQDWERRWEKIKVKLDYKEAQSAQTQSK